MESSQAIKDPAPKISDERTRSAVEDSSFEASEIEILWRALKNPLFPAHHEDDLLKIGRLPMPASGSNIWS